MPDLCTFLKSAQTCASFDTFTDNFEKTIFNAYKSGGTFFEAKTSYQVETIPYIKSVFLYIYKVLGFQW
jgi:hypothetical protein